MKKSDDMISMSPEDLSHKLVEMKKTLMKHNAQIAIGTALKSPGEVRDVKRSIARIKTLLKNKMEGTKNK